LIRSGLLNITSFCEALAELAARRYGPKERRPGAPLRRLVEEGLVEEVPQTFIRLPGGYRLVDTPSLKHTHHGLPALLLA
jgi:hypothetical protein